MTSDPVSAMAEALPPTLTLSMGDFLRKYGLDVKPPTSYTGAESRVIPSGQRNDTLTAIAGILRKTGLAPNLVGEAVRGIATSRQAVERIDYEDGELERIIEHISGRASEPFRTGSYEVETIDVDHTTVPPLRWLVRGFLPAEGLTLVFGLPANGKSYVALDICRICIVGGTWINGGEVTQIKRVGYFDWERRGAMFKRRALALMRGQGVTIDYVTCKEPLGNMINDIRELALTRGYELIILDSLSIAVMTGDLMAAHEVIPRMFALHELGIPILILDHMAKPQAGASQAYASAYGSMFKEAIVSMAWHVAKADPMRKTPGFMDFRLTQKKQNFDQASEPIDAHLLIEEDDHGNVIRTEIKPGFMSAVPPDMAIMDALTHRLETTRDEIAEITGIPANSVWNYLHKAGGLIDQGAVIVVTEGGSGRGKASKYAIAEWPNSERPV